MHRDHRATIVAANAAYRAAMQPIIAELLAADGGEHAPTMKAVNTEVYGLASALQDDVLAEHMRQQTNRRLGLPVGAGKE